MNPSANLLEKSDCKIAIVGARGAVGLEILGLLERLQVQPEQLLLYGSTRSHGQELSYAGNALRVRELTESSLENCQIAFFAAGSDVTKVWAQSFVDKAGAWVIDNSSAFRMEEGYSLIVPEVNPETIPAERSIIANPNCSTIILLLAIAPLLKKLGKARVVVSTYQAVSGAGIAGFDALERENKALYESGSCEGSFKNADPFPFQIAGNLFPLIGEVDGQQQATTEEYKMLNESRKILACSDLKMQVCCVRVPVSRCHSESVSLIFDGPVELAEAQEALRNAPGVKLIEEPELPPQPVDCSQQDEVYVGRLRQSEDCVLQLWVVGDQLLKGAALNAVQIAQLLPA